MNVKQQEEKILKVAVNKSLLKEHSKNGSSRVVYMDDQTEFQIQLFNPHKFLIGIQLSLDGNYESSLVCLKPGQRIWLERRLDDNHRLKFSTYEVDGDSKAVQKAIEQNGKIKIEAYKQASRRPIHFWNPSQYSYYNNSIGLHDPGLVYSSVSNLTDYCATTMTGAVEGTQQLFSTTTASFQRDAAHNTIETGRIERGNVSRQEFTLCDYDFESFAFTTEEVQILPSSMKPTTQRDISKMYCPFCGRKIKTSYKYCPFCGKKID